MSPPQQQPLFILFLFVVVISLVSVYLYSKYSEYKNKEEISDLQAKVKTKEDEKEDSLDNEII